MLSARSLTLSFNGAVSLKFSISVNSLPWEYWIVILSSYLRAQGGQRGKKDHHGTSCPEFSGLVGPCFLCGDFFPCKADPRHSDGPLPRERHDAALPSLGLVVLPRRRTADVFRSAPWLSICLKFCRTRFSRFFKNSARRIRAFFVILCYYL